MISQVNVILEYGVPGRQHASKLRRLVADAAMRMESRMDGNGLERLLMTS